MAPEISKISTSLPENFEEILDNLGGFGKFQALILGLILVFEIPTAYVIFIHIFTGLSPREWECDGQIVNAVGACVCNGTLSAPLTSFVAEWQLICDSAWVSDFITSIQMAGMLFGTVFASQASDWYGRRYTTTGIILALLLGSSVSAAAPNPYVYAAARFICGAGFASFLGQSAVYTMEFMPSRWRGLGHSLGPFGEATVMLALIANFIPDWRTLTWITTAPFGLILIVFPLLPESPRWLLQKGKTSELVKVLGYMSKVNGRPPIPTEAIERLVAKECPPPRVELDGSTKKQPRLNYSIFFQSNKAGLRMKGICIMAIFFSWSVIYFGLSFNIKNMKGNLYWNVAYLGITDAIGFPSAMIILNRFGRRMSVILSMSVGAVFLVVLAILQLILDVSSYPTLILMLSLCGKFGVSVARPATRALASESFPTSIRSMGTGLCGISASIGGVISAQLAYLGATNPSFPFFAFAVIGVTGSFFTLLMTETNGQPLQESVERKRSRAFSILSVIGANNLILKTKVGRSEAPI